MAANGISTLATKQLKQTAKLNLAGTNRATDGQPSTLDMALLPTVYTGNDVTTQPHPDGLVLGRPWTLGPPIPVYMFSSIPSSVDEGSAGTFNVTTTNVSNGTTLYWTVASNSGDFGTISGSFTITSNAGSFTVTPTADSSTEGSETFIVSLRTGSITGTVVATSNSVTINDTSVFEGLENSVQLATNSDFTNGTAGWSAAGGFGTYSYTSSNQVVLYNGELYFTYVTRTVARNINVSSVIANALSLKATVNIRHQQNGGGASYTSIDTYTFTATFKNSSGGTITTRTTGLSNAPQNATDIVLTLNKSEIPATFGNITSVDLAVSGTDTGYWNGNHGPIVKYIKLTAE